MGFKYIESSAKTFQGVIDLINEIMSGLKGSKPIFPGPYINTPKFGLENSRSQSNVNIGSGVNLGPNV